MRNVFLRKAALWIAASVGVLLLSTTWREAQSQTARAGAAPAGGQSAKAPGEKKTAGSVAPLAATADTNKGVAMGKIVLEFYPDLAPKHVANFKKLAGAGFYNGTTFHRVIPGFMIQGGDPNTKDNDRSNDGTGGPGYTVNAEFNARKHLRGTLSMARTQDPNGAGSQFFICVDIVPHLNGKYTVFGQTISGMDIVDRIVSAPRDARDNPLKRIVLKTVSIVPRGGVPGLPAASQGADPKEVAVIEVVQER